MPGRGNASGSRETVFQVIRTRITEATLPNQVMEIETTSSKRVAEAVREIWSRLPNVRAGREVVRVVER